MPLSVENPSSFARAMSGYYGDDWLEWTPEATEHVLQNGFEYNPDAKEIDKIEAVKSVLRDNMAITTPLVFEKAVMALSDKPVSFQTWQGASPEDLAVGLYHISKIMGEESLRKGISRGVRAYIASILVEEDIHAGPEELLFDVAKVEIRSLSGTPKKVREQVLSRFSEVMSGPSSQVEERMRSVATDIKETAVVAAPEAGGKAQEEGRFVRQQVGRLASIALYLRERGVL